MERTFEKNQLVIRVATSIIILINLFGCQQNSEQKEVVLPLKSVQMGWNETVENGKKIKAELINVRDSVFVNQRMEFRLNGEMDSSASKFFYIKVPDTLHLGPNMGQAELYTFNRDYVSRASAVVLTNKYSEDETRKDTFYGDPKNLEFGIFASETGPRTIEGEIREVILTKDEEGNGYKIHLTSFFNEKVFVKDTTGGKFLGGN